MNTKFDSDISARDAAGADVIDSGADPTVKTQYVVLTQVKSYRVVYFTTDPQYMPPMEGDWYFASTYSGPLPPGMTLRNCWAWRFNGNTFVYAGDQAPQSKEQALVDANKKALRSILKEKIARIREPYFPCDAFGHELRTRKRLEAKNFLEQPDADANYAYLEATAVARNLSMTDAARLILMRAEQMEKMLVATERVRERFALLIEQADSQERLLSLRAMLLEDLYPELSREFRYNFSNTKPIDVNATLSEQALVHERARLRAMLREKINELREPLEKRYVHNDQMMLYKAQLAAVVLGKNVSNEKKLDMSLLRNCAEISKKSEYEIAATWKNELREHGRLLEETEKNKCALLVAIENESTSTSLREIENEIFQLSSTPRGK